MPFVRKGKTIYKKVAGRLVKKGKSKSVRMAKRYLKALHAHTKDS